MPSGPGGTGRRMLDHDRHATRHWTPIAPTSPLPHTARTADAHAEPAAHRPGCAHALP
ncbi:hypothetical protein FM103_11700 [Corynebacterium xerosis]|nr:hypothetical protein FM103_11700 [Corynebacterium xerosis]